MLRLIAAAAFCLVLLAQPAAADFRTGVVAVQEERFEDARRAFTQGHENGDIRSTFMLGVMFEHGWGTKANPAEASQWYKRAADGGMASAQYNLGILYQDGRGVRRDETKAAGLFAMAAAQGHGKAMNNLGSYYDTGTGVPADRVEALKWFTLAAKYLEGEERLVANENVLRTSQRLSSAQIQVASQRAAEWIEANDPENAN